MLKKTLQIIVFAICIHQASMSQGLPKEMYLSPDLRTLYTGGKPDNGLYDQTQIKQVYLNFPQANYWTLLIQNYANKIELAAGMTVDGVLYDSVGVRFKGQTSYSQTQNSQKKSFNITTDNFKPGQDIDGYNILNLNNCFDDPSFTREYFYLNQIKKHIPVAKCAYVHLYINGQNWGLYPNVQQLNKDFYTEWFMSNNGTNWRADKPAGSPGNPGWGDGTAALNFLGNDTSLYKQYYQLKSTNSATPWNDLRNGCSRLNKPSLANLPTMLPDSMDVDRALWHLASETAFSDDDSYIFKGKMDYYVYYEPETHRITPIEYDGNSVMRISALNWSPFYNETKVNYPLMNRLYAVPEWRQRYLAHLRTIISESFDTAVCNLFLNQNKAFIDSVVLNDPKKLYSYTAFNTENTALKTWMNNRKNYLMSNIEVNQTGPAISNVSFATNSVTWTYPTSADSVGVNATVTSGNGINKVTLFYATGIVGNFTSSLMYDDGMHGDASAADGIYGAYIPAQNNSQWVRYYIEAKAGNSYKTAMYSPVGAEHDVYVYFVTPVLSSDTTITINEVMASNSNTAMDNAGEYDDWIELYNKSGNPVDISGYFITDDTLNLEKFELPQGTIINPNNYLILWADEDGSQGPLHLNFKLSSAGERVWLLNPNRELVDKVEFGQQITDQGYARVPNGTGNFVIQNPTFGYNNNLFSSVNENIIAPSIVNVFPNPANEFINIVTNQVSDLPVTIVNAIGQIKISLQGQPNYFVDTQSWQNGIYFIRYGENVVKIVVSH
ncbi:MAG TPA: CotH kinase family protein [Bacteroidia bacterium]|nr:CotH kinase family protein [Bacteroidia bacterium]